MAGNPLCDLVYDCVWPNSIPKKNHSKRGSIVQGNSSLLCERKFPTRRHLNFSVVKKANVCKVPLRLSLKVLA